MNAFVLALRQIRYENTAFWRNPAAAFFTIVFPLMFLVIFNLVFGDVGTDEKGEPVNTANFFVPGCRPSAIMGHVRGVENPRD